MPGGSERGSLAARGRLMMHWPVCLGNLVSEPEGRGGEVRGGGGVLLKMMPFGASIAGVWLIGWDWAWDWSGGGI